MLQCSAIFGLNWLTSLLESAHKERSEEAWRLVAGEFEDRFAAAELPEYGDLRFEYRSVPTRVSFDETKHGESDMTIESVKDPSPDRMACWAYRIIMPWWQDS